MPQVPIVASPEVRRNLPSGGFNTTRASGDAFGAGVAGATQQIGSNIGQVGDALEKQATKIKQEDDQMALLGAENQLLQWEQGSLYDPENGYFSSEGKNAIGGSDELPAEYDKRVGEVLNQLQNDDQRRAFIKVATQRRMSVQNSVAKHEASQRKRVLREESEALQQQSLDAASSSYTDPNAVAFNINRGVASIIAQSVQEGDSDTVRMQKVKEFTSDAHVSVINRMMQDSPTQAMQYFEDNKDLMTSSAVGAVEKDLEVEVEKDVARNESERIFDEGGGLNEMLKKARSIKDTGVSDETLSRIKIMHAEQEAVKQERSEQAWSSLVDNPSLDNIPANIDGTERKKMRDYVTKLQSGDGVSTDWNYYYELSNMSEDQLNKAQIDPSRLSSSHLKEFIDAQAKVRNGDSSGYYDVSNVATVSKELATSAGVKNKDTQAKFTARVRSEVEQEQAQLGRKLKYEEVKKVADRLLIERPGFWSSPEVFQVEVKGVDPLLVDEAVNVLLQYDMKASDENIRDIVEGATNDREKIVEVLQERGAPVTTSNIFSLYMLTKRGGNQ